LFTPDSDNDPYDNNLAIHLNLGAKSWYDAGPAATNALSHEADIAKVQEWLGHANVCPQPASTTGARQGRRIRLP